MSTENESDDDDCEYCKKIASKTGGHPQDNPFFSAVLTPSAHQYNIVEKIKEANQLYSEDPAERQTQPKVKFKDNLVEFEPGDESAVEIMENISDNKSVEESEDDGYIDDEVAESISVIDERDEIQVNPERDVIGDKQYSQEEFENELGDDGNLDPSDIQEGGEGEEEGEEEGEDGTITEPAEKAHKSNSLRPRSSKVSPASESAVEESRKIRKLCCFFKETDEYKQKLPNYNGFNSNYGLSKDEIAKREVIQSKKQQVQMNRHIQQIEHEEFMASVNEEAFAKW